MRTVGIDLSASKQKTGVAAVEGRAEGKVVVKDVSVGTHTDEDLISLVRGADKTGIDCQFGWPDPFVDYIKAHRAGGTDLDLHPEPRHALYRRATDQDVIDQAAILPLVVSANLIGATAMRCARILSLLNREVNDVDRTGRTGPVVEVYPAAMLKIWGLRHNGYKTSKNVETRRTVVAQVEDALPWLDLGEFRNLCIAKDDALDAVLCAVMARLVEQGRALPLPGDKVDVASREGWIALPRPLPVRA